MGGNLWQRVLWREKVHKAHSILLNQMVEWIITKHSWFFGSLTPKLLLESKCFTESKIFLLWYLLAQKRKFHCCLFLVFLNPSGEFALSLILAQGWHIYRLIAYYCIFFPVLALRPWTNELWNVCPVRAVMLLWDSSNLFHSRQASKFLPMQMSGHQGSHYNK